MLLREKKNHKITFYKTFCDDKLLLKSMLFKINVYESWLSGVASVMNCKHGRLPFFFLGLFIGGDSRKLNFWYPLIDCI